MVAVGDRLTAENKTRANRSEGKIMKNIMCEDLRVCPKLIAEANGYEGNINMTSVWSALIKEAGKCEAYASDILIDLIPMVEQFKEAMPTGERTYFFGFRDMGIDHSTFIESRNDLSQYRAVWRMKTMVVGSEYGGRNKVAVYLQECLI